MSLGIHLLNKIGDMDYINGTKKVILLSCYMLVHLSIHFKLKYMYRLNVTK